MRIVLAYGVLFEGEVLTTLLTEHCDLVSQHAHFVETLQDEGMVRQILYGIQVEETTADKPMPSYKIPRNPSVLLEAQYSEALEAAPDPIKEHVKGAPRFYLLFGT